MLNTSKPISFATAFGLLLLFIGCSPSVPPATPLTETEINAAIVAASPEIVYRDEVTRDDRKGYEATKWIAASGNHAPFASNHFQSREDALKFVRSLYKLGATAVYAVHIMDEPDRIKAEGGPYSDSLFVYLPSDRSRRRALFEVEAREAKAEGFAPAGDQGQERLFFWWD
jgi:hypothetical protein